MKQKVEEEAPVEERAKEAPVEDEVKKSPKKRAPKKTSKKEDAPEKPSKKRASRKAKKEEAVEEPPAKVKTEKVPDGASEEVGEIPLTTATEEEIESPEEVSGETSEEKVSKETPRKRSVKKPKDEGPFPEDLVFGRYNSKEVVVEDSSLKAFINLDPSYVPHSSARHANKPFHKHKISIVERLINNMMRTEKYTGKKTKSYMVVLDAFQLIEKRMKDNPVQVLVRAIENSAPREEVTRLKFGGISVPKSVDTAPARRLDIALRNISIGTIKASHKSKRSISECLAAELIAASKGDIQSFAVSKRDEVERVAKSAH
ncbi:MAG: 30S ribosomal protein S7 [Candidatus Thermoplasmatota archaeon]|nr:30S ribosomal protein S7 [Candidatus Thermoplasmatota archaeon]